MARSGAISVVRTFRGNGQGAQKKVGRSVGHVDNGSRQSRSSRKGNP
jgi:hypothetical protein